MYVNQFDKGGIKSAEGNRAEQNFADLFKERFGVEPIKATADENRFLHIDYWMMVGNRKASVDVKSWKYEKDNVWVEFVSYGRLGWIYGGADYIGFETPDMENFIMVKREELEEYVRKKCSITFVDNKEKAVYNLYVRVKENNGVMWFDCVTLIPRNDLYGLSHWMLKD